MNNLADKKEFTACYLSLINHYGLQIEKINARKLMKTAMQSSGTEKELRANFKQEDGAIQVQTMFGKLSA